jgi:hypothetical protein
MPHHFQMNSQTSSHPSDKKVRLLQKYLSTERTKLHKHRLLKAIATISAHEQECTGVYMPSVGIVVRRRSRVEGNMDIWWSPSFQSDRVWFANENGCGYLEIA